LAQNVVQNSSLLIFEDVIAYVAAYSTTYTNLAELSSASWLNCGALAELSFESANATVQPASLNVEHGQIITKEEETINITLQEYNSSIVNYLRGGVSQQVTTNLGALGSSKTTISLDVMYSGDADTITPCMLKFKTTLSDGRTKQIFYPKVLYVSGGAASNPKAQGSGEYQTQAFSLRAAESTALVYTNRKSYRIECFSTVSS
jgi:hypothetical protein